jgi:hypothetical protein
MMEAAILNRFGIKGIRTSKACGKLKGQLTIFLIASG